MRRAPVSLLACLFGSSDVSMLSRDGESPLKCPGTGSMGTVGTAVRKRKTHVSKVAASGVSPGYVGTFATSKRLRSLARLPSRVIGFSLKPGMKIGGGSIDRRMSHETCSRYWSLRLQYSRKADRSSSRSCILAYNSALG